MSKVEDYARPLDAIEILVDEHALPGRLTPLGDITDMRFVATPDTIAVIEGALADGMREGASLSEMTAKVQALTPITRRGVRIVIDDDAERHPSDDQLDAMEAWTHANLPGWSEREARASQLRERDILEAIRGLPPTVHDVARITEPTLLSLIPPASRYVIEEGGSISGIKEGARISEGIRWDGPNGGYMWAATTERIPAPNTAERAALKRHHADRKRRKKATDKSKRRNR